MTNMNFALSPSLSSQLSQPGVYAYAFAFQGAAYTSQTTLVSNGVVQPAANLSLNLGTTFSSGAVYVVIQQGGNGSLPATLISGNNPLGNINPLNAATNNYSYQLFEATLSNSAFDQGDISALNTFGLPSSYSVSVNGAPVTLGFASGQTGAGIYTALNNTQTFSPNSFTSPDRLAIGPATTANAAPFSSADWTQYVNNLKNNPAVLADITLVVPFAGGTSLQPAPMLSEYGLRYVAADSFGTDYFWLVPNIQHGATNTDWIRIPASTLMKNIYVQPDSLLIYPDNGHGAPSTSPKPSLPSFTPNNADGAVAKYLVSGFDAGYWGGSGTSANPKDATVSDLNKTWNWNVNYAYDATLTSTAIKYSNTLGSGPGTVGGNNRFYDPWAQEIQKVSNAYGYSYTDLVSTGGVNPQVTLWDPSQNGGRGGNVANINISLFANSETLPSTSGFQTAPKVYIPPTGADYSPVNTAGTSGIGFAFQFGLGSLNFAPNGKTPAVFKFYAPSDAMADKTTGFVSLNIPVLSGTINSSNTPETSAWNVLFVTGGPGHWALGTGGAPNPYSQQAGFFSVNNVPVTADGSTGWYQLVFGGAGAQTVYNIYAGSNATTHQFLPVKGSNANPNNFVVDHGVSITQAPTLPNYTLNFAPGGDMLYSIKTFSAPNTLFGNSAANALVGTGGDDPFHAGPGDDTIHGADGTDTAVHWEPARNFALKSTAGSSTVTLQDKVGNEGTDTLTSVEQIQFRDTTIDTTWLTKTAALPVAQIMKVVDLYTAGLNRAPDAVGLDYWASRLADGASISDIAKIFFSAAEAAPLYSPANSNSVFVDLAYQTALGRAPDAAGAAYWLAELNTGHIQRTDFVTSLIAGARGAGGSAADAAYIANKEAVGAHFALTQGLTNVAWARTVESAVNGTAASVTAANAQTDGFAAMAAMAASSELVVQITGIVP